MTIEHVESKLRRHGFEMMVVIGRRVLVGLRRRPPRRSYFGRGETLREAIGNALARVDHA